MKVRYKETLSAARIEAKKTVGSDTILGARENNPEFIRIGTWHELIDNYWGTDEYEEKCKTASRNRRIEREESIATHTGGSVNFATHEVKLVF